MAVSDYLISHLAGMPCGNCRSDPDEPSLTQPEEDNGSQTM